MRCEYPRCHSKKNNLFFLIVPKGQTRTSSEHAPCAYIALLDLLICEMRFPEHKLSGLSGSGGDSVRDDAHKDRPKNVPGSTSADDAALCREPRDTGSFDRVRATSSSDYIVPLALWNDHILGEELGVTKREECLANKCERQQSGQFAYLMNSDDE